MFTGMTTAATALDAFQTSVEATANNLANVNTTAFKRSQIDFQDLFYTGQNNLQVGNGVRVSDISTRDFRQGGEEPTGRELDVLITGNGFFSVQQPDGSIRYTRDGSFQKDGLGRLVTSTGGIVQPPITFPADTISTSITADGVVSVVTGSEPNKIKVLGQIQLTSFPNPAGLSQEANNLFAETPASGTGITAIAGTNGLGTLKQKSLEGSNVDMTTEMTQLVTAQRAYDANSKVLTTSYQLVGSALDIIR